LPGQKFELDRRESELVRAMVEILAGAGLLGGHVVRRSSDMAHRVVRPARKLRTDSEVEKLDEILLAADPQQE